MKAHTYELLKAAAARARSPIASMTYWIVLYTLIVTISVPSSFRLCCFLATYSIVVCGVAFED
jgi:hypothetical protein